jgi:hypothetical protein
LDLKLRRRQPELSETPVTPPAVVAEVHAHADERASGATVRRRSRMGSGAVAGSRAGLAGRSLVLLVWWHAASPLLVPLLEVTEVPLEMETPLAV